jgi:hypothetical protein
MVAPDQAGRTLVHEIAKRGCIRQFAALLKPEDLTIKDDAGSTPLFEFGGGLADIPPAFWRPHWMSLGLDWVERTTFCDRLKANLAYVRERFTAFHPELQALFLADLIAR